MAAVAPCAGAWVEIFIKSAGAGAIRSPPVRGRGLKSLAQLVPVVGHVAPCAGAWVEIVEHFGRPLCYKWSPPVRGRGLKLTKDGDPDSRYPSPPVRGRGLKFSRRQMPRAYGPSPPVRGRGLKFNWNGLPFRRTRRPLCGGVG